jgi:endothelin-converting enzyme
MTLTEIIDACGGWERRVEIPSDRSRYGTIDEVSEANERILREIFSGPYPSSSPKENLPDLTEAIDVQNFEKLKDAYNACLNETAIEEVGPAPLLSLLEQVISKYPVESACNPIKFQASGLDADSTDKVPHCSDIEGSLTHVIEYLQSIGAGALFSLVVSVSSPKFLHLIVQEDSKNTSVNIMSLYQDGSGLPSKNHYTQDDILRNYEKAIHESFIAVFGAKDAKKFASYAEKIVEFEKVLKAAEMDPEDIQDETKT